MVLHFKSETHIVLAKLLLMLKPSIGDILACNNILVCKVVVYAWI